MPDSRYRAVSRVLAEVLVLNLAVAIAKIAYGYVSGAVSILSDGFHSLTDGLSNVAALVGVRLARKPPDEDHRYGHRKFETLAAVLIAAFLMLVLVEIGQAAIARLRGGDAATITPVAFVVMIGTVLVNLLVTTYERRRGRQLGSEVLLADAMHTQSDVYTSLTVIAALIGARLGFPLLDPIAAIVVMLFIARAGWQIALVDGENPVHVREVERQSAVRRVDMAFERGAGAERHGGHAVRARHVHHLAHLLGALHPDHGIGRLVGDPGDGVGMLAADLRPGLQPLSEPLAQHGDDGGNVARRDLALSRRQCH